MMNTIGILFYQCNIILYLLLFVLSLLSPIIGQPEYPPFDPTSQANLFLVDGQARTRGQSPFELYSSIRDIEWENIDRRADENWWHLYPFGERYDDGDVLDRPFNDQQIDLDFFFPYHGFRYNYTFIFPEGYIAFSYPWYIQPPYTYPNPLWPDRPDPSLIAAFMIDQTAMAVGEEKLSHVWYRVVSRPVQLVGNTGPGMANRDGFLSSFTGDRSNPSGPMTRARTYQGHVLKTAPGRVEDPELLDKLTLDLREGMVGARGFVASYAVIITWERMGYGGTPKTVDISKYRETLKLQNTYQMVIMTDEIRSYTMFNYGNIWWTSSTSSGAFSGRGGRQSAVVGFNGGNGTGFVELPYSSEGNSYKLMEFGSTPVAGRWLARVDEVILYGGCTNDSTGVLKMAFPYGTMLGGWAINVSGPCFRPGNNVKLQLDELTVDCTVLNMAIAYCVIPVYRIFRVGAVDIKLSIDGGRNYPFWNKFNILRPDNARNWVHLINDPLKKENNWFSLTADNLTLAWSKVNITNVPGKTVDITLWGYWEDVLGHRFEPVGYIARNMANTGKYSFNPRMLSQSDYIKNMWKTFAGGVVQVKATETYELDTGDGMYFSNLIPFGWYWKEHWEEEYGEDWALDKCLEWYDYDGRRYNFWRDLEPQSSCPCTLNQALADFGRFLPEERCNMFGDSLCDYTYGARHCVISSTASWTGAGQQCCYDQEGWLMFTDDYEYNNQYLRFYTAGRPYRAHPYGSFPYKRPPYVPSLSSFQNDYLPYDMCCRYAEHCEFYFWRRQSSGCQDYNRTKLGFAYGDPHFVTFDNVKYTMNGRGYYVLTMMDSPRQHLMVQIRMEQPVKTIWGNDVPATVITGVAATSNGSSIVQLFARKNHMRWRYKMDMYIDNQRYFGDKNHKKIHFFRGVTIFNQPRNMDMSEIDLMFHSGVGIKVKEFNGMLSVAVSMPPQFNETLADEYQLLEEARIVQQYTGKERCSSHYRTLGLLGVYNDDPDDDLTTPDCDTPVRVSKLGFGRSEEDTMRQVYNQFGHRWQVDGVKIKLLFHPKFQALYNPLEFAKKEKDYIPVFDVKQRSPDFQFYESLAFDFEQITLQCQGVKSCIFDYVVTGRKEIGLSTLKTEREFKALKATGEKKLRSCGPLTKNRGVLKWPIGNNYLEGVTVRFTCKPEYFLHGTPERTCRNGTWSPGWWCWCRTRTEENALKWMTGIVVSLLFIAIIAFIFIWCYCLRVKGRKWDHKRARRPIRSTTPPAGSTSPHMLAPLAVLETDPIDNLYQKSGDGSGSLLFSNGQHAEPHRVGLSTQTNRVALPPAYNEMSV